MSDLVLGRPAAPLRPTEREPTRRQALALVAGVAVGAGPLSASAQGQAPTLSVIQTTLGEGQRFEPAAVTELARALSRRPYAAVPSDLPEALSNLSYEQYIGIRALPTAQIWGGEGRGFVLEPLHRGFVFSAPVLLFTVEDGSVRRVAYERNRFEFGRVNVPANLGDLGFSGFRLFTTGWGGQPEEFALVQGASFFRALARGQIYGVVARAL
ncbi:MAG TPA: glucan biosynthesis protein, partial [Beijerinckiaceae bacterium]|nr:glucan biosynthesis protein [Beijerinckiaceae bacterium]